MRKKPNYRRRRTAAVLGLLVAVVLVLLLLPRGSGTGRPKGQGTPQLTFASRVINVSQAQSPAEATAKANGDAIVKMFTDYYQTAFVDPRKWGDGMFPTLRTLFAQEVQGSFTKDLDSLTIGEARTDLKFVDPGATSLIVTVYYDAKSQPTLAVAAATFNGKGTLKKTGPPLAIHEKATFYLQKQGSGWTITSYDANQTQNTPTPSPSPSAT